jgi:urea transport system permease protein
MVVLVPGVLALVFGYLAFRSRVTGVYLSIITQALTYALLLAFFRNDMGFGGNNGLTDFKDMLGFPCRRSPRAAACWCCPRCSCVRQFLFAGPLRRYVALRQGADRGARHRIAHAVPGLPAGILQAVRVGCCRR